MFEVVGVCVCLRSGACSPVGRLSRGAQEDAGRLLQNRLDAFDVCADGSSGVGNFETIKLCQQGINRDLRIQLGGEAPIGDPGFDDASDDLLPGEKDFIEQVPQLFVACCRCHELDPQTRPGGEVGDVEEIVEGLSEAGPRVCAFVERCSDQSDDVLRMLLIGAENKVFAGVEIVLNGPDRDACGSRDVLEADPRYAALTDQPQCRCDDDALAVGDLLF